MLTETPVVIYGRKVFYLVRHSCRPDELRGRIGEAIVKYSETRANWVEDSILPTEEAIKQIPANWWQPYGIESFTPITEERFWSRSRQQSLPARYT